MCGKTVYILIKITTAMWFQNPVGVGTKVLSAKLSFHDGRKSRLPAMYEPQLRASHGGASY